MNSIDNYSCNTVFIGKVTSEDAVTFKNITAKQFIGTAVSSSKLISNLSVIKSPTLADSLVAKNININNAVTTNFLTETLNCSTLDVKTLVTPDYNVATLFADQISSAQQVTVKTYKVEKQVVSTQTKGLSTLSIILISVAVILAVVALAAVTCGVAVGLAVAASAGEGFATTLVAITEVSVFGGATVIYGAVASFTPAIITVTELALGTGIIVGSLAIASVFTEAQPTLRTITMNASYGTSFVSDCIFGTTSYSDNTAGYLSFLTIQNEINGLFALPRIIGYNTVLGFFDDYTSFGGLEAYLSLCTITTQKTLRFESNGNLSIYGSPLSPAIWQSGTQVSSIKYKENIQQISNPLDKLEKIDGVRYNFKGEDGPPKIGLLAQQVNEVCSEAVFGSENSGYRVKMEKLIPLILESMKELYLKQQEVLNLSLVNK